MELRMEIYSGIHSVASNVFVHKVIAMIDDAFGQVAELET